VNRKKRYLTTIATLLLCSCASRAPLTSSFRERAVEYQSGDVTLAAALLEPDDGRRHPAVVILQGSGASDRTNRWARDIAESMARRGIAVLLTDKRGSGKSGGDWKTSGYDTLASDALAGVRYLRSLAAVQRNAVGLVGLSQGGSIAPLAASMTTDIAFVVDISGSATTAVEQSNHEMRNTFRQAGLPEESVAAGMELQRLAGEYIRNGDWKSYENARNQALHGPLAPVAEGFPATEDSWVWKFWRKVGDYDPLAYWKQIKRPALVIYGEQDEDDNVPVRASVERLKKEVVPLNGKLRIEVYSGSGHAIFAPGTHELRPDFVELLSSWIHSVV
jgi:pimeloyl-ACP methyl ester carboxylesterase